jgi:hypothetical protein
LSAEPQVELKHKVAEAVGSAVNPGPQSYVGHAGLGELSIGDAVAQVSPENPAAQVHV